MRCSWRSMRSREVHEKVIGGKRDRNSSPKTGSINPGRGSDNCCPDLGCRPWSCGKCKGGHGRFVWVKQFFSKLSLSTFRLDGKVSTDGIQQDLGLRLAQNRVAPALTLCYVVALHQVLNEINKTKRLLFSSPRFVSFPSLTTHIGEHLRWEVQHWLSPPDPSTNQNFVRRARLKGTTAWFFEGNALAEWKSRGSLLWIHGKRTFF
jgi:hypothetical protein